jgi:hypothetical protein
MATFAVPLNADMNDPVFIAQQRATNSRPIDRCRSADGGPLILLRSRRQRPCSRGTAEKPDEFSSPYGIYAQAGEPPCKKSNTIFD